MDFSQLGLAVYEAKAYESLVRRGKATASVVSQDSGVPYGRIYDVLADLERKGLVTVLPEATKKFTPANPEKLQELFEEKKKDLETLEKGIAELKNIYSQHPDEPVIIARGKRNFYRIVKQTPEVKTFNYSIRYTSEVRPDWLRGQKEKVEKGIDVKTLTRFDDETEKNLKTWVKYQPNQRVFDNDGVAMGIQDGAVMIALIKSNTTLLIRDEPFIDVMRRLFAAAYEKAPEVSRQLSNQS